MKINILTFGIARDIVGASNLTFDIKDNAKVEDLKQALLEAYPVFQNLNSLLIAVNSEYGDEQQLIRPNDEIALIPPVSGG